MELDKFIIDKLHAQKASLASWAFAFDNELLRNWSVAWSDSGLMPKAILDTSINQQAGEPSNLINIENARFLLALGSFKNAVENFETTNFDLALQKLFLVENYLGQRQGIHIEKMRAAQEKSDRSQAENRNIKALVIKRLKDGEFSNLSNEEAGNQLAKLEPLKPRTLTKYVAQYRRQSKAVEKLIPNFASAISDLTRDDALKSKEKVKLTEDIDGAVELLKQSFLDDLLNKSS